MTSQEIRNEEKNLGNRNPLTPFQYFQMETGLQNPTKDTILQDFKHEEDEAKKKGEEHPFKVLGKSDIGYQLLYESLTNIIKIHEQIEEINNTIKQLTEQKEKHQQDITYRNTKITELKKIAKDSFDYKNKLQNLLQQEEDEANKIKRNPTLERFLQQTQETPILSRKMMLTALKTNNGDVKGLVKAMKNTFEVIRDYHSGKSHSITNIEVNNSKENNRSGTNNEDTNNKDTTLENCTLAGRQITYRDENGKTLKLDETDILKTKGRPFTLNGLTETECNLLNKHGEKIIQNINKQQQHIEFHLLQQQSKLNDLDKNLEESRKSFFEKDLSLDFLGEDLIRNNIPEKTRKGILRILGSQGFITPQNLTETLKINYPARIERILTEHHCFRE